MHKPPFSLEGGGHVSVNVIRQTSEISFAQVETTAEFKTLSHSVLSQSLSARVRSEVLSKVLQATAQGSAKKLGVAKMKWPSHLLAIFR